MPDMSRYGEFGCRHRAGGLSQGPRRAGGKKSSGSEGAFISDHGLLDDKIAKLKGLRKDR